MADRCWRCGSAIEPSDAFCRSCGAKVSADAPDLDVFTDVAEQPTGPVAATDDDGSRWPLAVGMALVGIVVAVFAFTGTDDGPSADPYDERADFDLIDEADDTDLSTATTEAVTPSEIAAPLDWRVARVNASGVPLATIELDDSIFVFDLQLDRGFAWYGFQGEVVISEYTRAGVWVEHGPLAPGAAITQVVRGENGALAVGFDDQDRPTLWRSPDGITWEPELLPTPSIDGFSPSRPINLIEHDGVVIVAGQESNPWIRISEAVEAQFGELDQLTPSWTWNDEMVTINGPLGLAVDEIPLADLGIDRSDMNSAGNRHPVPVWIHDDGEWRADALGAQISSLSAMDGDPAIFVTTPTNTGLDVMAYVDGAWVERESATIDWQLLAGPAGFVTFAERNRFAVLDDDLQVVRWIQLPVDGGNLADWSVNERGLAVLDTEWPAALSEPDAPGERLVLLRDGYRLGIVDESGLLELNRDGERVMLIGAWSSDSDRLYRAELEAVEPRIVFVDETTGHDLVHFTLSELHELEESLRPQYDPGNQQLSVVASRDLDTWYGGDFDTIDVSAEAMARLTVTSDRVLLAIVSAEDGTAPLGQPGPLVYSLLEAPLPDP